MTSPLGRVPPRLLNLEAAADYLGISYWSVRDYVLQGLIPTIDLPPKRPRPGDRPRTQLRRVLVDREDLDRFIDSRKSGHTAGTHPAEFPAFPRDTEDAQSPARRRR